MSRRCLTLGLVVLCSVATASLHSFGQDNGGSRKIVVRVTPVYPPLARDMHINGSVKVEAVVFPNGTVRLVEVKGGHPVLAEAAVEAVSKWKWEPANHESREPVELKFMPVH